MSKVSKTLSSCRLVSQVLFLFLNKIRQNGQNLSLFRRFGDIGGSVDGVEGALVEQGISDREGTIEVHLHRRQHLADTAKTIDVRVTW